MQHQPSPEGRPRIEKRVLSGVVSALHKRWVQAVAVFVVLVAAVGVYFLVVAKTVEVAADGQLTKVTLYRAGTTVADALAAAGVKLAEGDETLPSPKAALMPGATIAVVRAVPFTVTADGERRSFRTTRATVAAALAQAGVKIGPHDIVKPDPNSRLSSGSAIQITRVTQKDLVRSETLAYKTRTVYNNQLERGREKVLQPGAAGQKEKVVRITYHDGREMVRQVVSERVVKKPLERVVEVGLKPVVRTLVTSRGAYRYRDVFVMEATAYSPHPRSTAPYSDGITATGVKAKRGIVAVDPRVIPLGTWVYVTGYGEGLAADVGGAIKGMRIDVAFNEESEAILFGRRHGTRVYILDKEPVHFAYGR